MMCREMFETLRLYVNQNLTSIPLIFVLGFYVRNSSKLVVV
jgi:hypothetical protein